MAQFKLPLSGNVTQWINPMIWFMSGNELNVYVGDSSAPEVEKDALDRVGSYGKQLGQVCDALIAVLKLLPNRDSLSPAEKAAIDKFEAMANEIATVKERHKRPALRP